MFYQWHGEERTSLLNCPYIYIYRVRWSSEWDSWESPGENVGNVEIGRGGMLSCVPIIPTIPVSPWLVLSISTWDGWSTPYLGFSLHESGRPIKLGELAQHTIHLLVRKQPLAIPKRKYCIHSDLWQLHKT
jgi:hypothetical protein